MLKRKRWNDEELLEPFAALLRQSTSRVVERLRLMWTRNNTFNLGNTMPMAPNEERTQLGLIESTNKSTQLLPIDRLVIEYTLYYLDCTHIPQEHYIRLAQDVLAGSVERIRFAALFSKSSSLPILCEALVEENSASAIESAMSEIEAWTDVRATLGEWIANRRVPQSSADGLVKNEMGNYDDDEDDDEYYGRESEEEEEQQYYNTSMERMRNASRLNELEDNKNYTDSDALLDFVAFIYKSLEFWVRVQSFINALSEGFAKMNVIELEPRYERELMLLLHRLSRNKTHVPSTVAKEKQEITNPTVSTLPTHSLKEGMEAKYNMESKLIDTNSNNNNSDIKVNNTELKTITDSVQVKVEKSEGIEEQQEQWEEDQPLLEQYEQEEKLKNGGEEKKSEVGYQEGSSNNNDQDEADKYQLANVVLGDTLALSHCYVPAIDHSTLLGNSTPSITTSSTLPARATLMIDIPDKLQEELCGINYQYYTMVHARLGMMITREQLRLFGLHHVCNPPQLTPQQNELLNAAQMQAMQQGNMFNLFGSNNMNVNGVPVDYIPDQNYYTRLLASQQDAINEDEEIYTDEVIDYYMRKKNIVNSRGKNQEEQRQQQMQQQSQRVAGSRAGNVTAYRDTHNNNSSNINNNKPLTTELIKPHRFCKVKTGYTWNQYNRTHYDSRTNPPPRTVLWYEFTLFYPALVNTKKDMRHIFHIEDTPRGAEDNYCLLVFSVGPPYADVAYRIVKKQWDTRKGGVRISFDATGRYKLFFRFTNSNYRR